MSVIESTTAQLRLIQKELARQQHQVAEGNEAVKRELQSSISLLSLYLQDVKGVDFSQAEDALERVRVLADSTKETKRKLKEHVAQTTCPLEATTLVEFTDATYRVPVEVADRLFSNEGPYRFETSGAGFGPILALSRSERVYVTAEQRREATRLAVLFGYSPRIMVGLNPPVQPDPREFVHGQDVLVSFSDTFAIDVTRRGNTTGAETFVLRHACSLVSFGFVHGGESCAALGMLVGLTDPTRPAIPGKNGVLCALHSGLIYTEKEGRDVAVRTKGVPAINDEITFLAQDGEVEVRFDTESVVVAATGRLCPTVVLTAPKQRVLVGDIRAVSAVDH